MTLAPLEFYSRVLGRTIRVPAEFITDFASVPRLPLTWWLVGDTGHRAAVVHDFLYQQQTVPRAPADAVFAEALRYDDQDPEPAWRRGIAWAGVRAGGWLAWRRHGERTAALNPEWSAQGWPA